MSSEDLIIIEDDVRNLYDESLKRFKIPGSNSPYIKEKIKNFYDIFGDKENNKVVFFLIDDNNKIINIGRTPYMKISFKNSIKNIIDKKNPKDKTNISHISYVDGIFGFTRKGEDRKHAYKSRVRFTNAIINCSSSLKEEDFFLPQPYPNFSGMYLKQTDIVSSKNIMSYANDIEDIELRGYKFYKIRDREKSFRYHKDYEKMVSVRKVLGAGIEITGRIYFNNLTNAELGLLLASIDLSLLDDNKATYYELIGGAKAYGYGKCQMNIKNVYLEKEYEVRNFDDLGFESCKDYSKFIDDYKEDMKVLLEENSRTIEEYKFSKKLISDIENELHYLDFLNANRGKDKMSAYKQGQILIPLEDIMSEPYLTRISNKDMHEILSKKFKIK